MALGFFQRLLEDLREHHGLLKATPTLQSALVLKHIGLEVKPGLEIATNTVAFVT